MARLGQGSRDDEVYSPQRGALGNIAFGIGNISCHNHCRHLVPRWHGLHVIQNCLGHQGAELRMTLVP